MYILLGIGSIGIFGKYPFIIYLIFGITFSYMAIVKKRLLYPKNKNFYILIIFSIVYSIFAYINNNYFSTFLLIGPPIAYYCGTIIAELVNHDEHYITKCIVAIAVGFFIHAMLNYMININSLNRNTIDFWTKEMSSATLQATMLTMILSLEYWGVFYTKKIWLKVIFIIFLILAILYISIIGSRTPLAIAIIVFLANLIIDGIYNKRIRKTMKIFGIVVIVIMIAIVTINSNEYIRESIKESNIIKRFLDEATIESDLSRLKSQILGIGLVIEHPMGTDETIEDLKYVHNMWLDVGKEVGILPCILLIIYTINTIKSLICIIKGNNVSHGYKILIGSLYMGININFLLEPIIQGIPFLFVIFIIINGLIDSQCDLYKRKIENNDKEDNKVCV